MSALTSRVALVTGASRGIGKSIALALASAGADIAVNYNSNSAAAKSICEQIRAKGGNALPVQADVSKTQDVDRLVSTIERELGPPTILVNNAGIAELLPAEKVTEEIFERYLRVNLP
jgi:NAD(P)-dependent dehydrogenase (short-subunit alcohol dehydrogenase family)